MSMTFRGAITLANCNFPKEFSNCAGIYMDLESACGCSRSLEINVIMAVIKRSGENPEIVRKKKTQSERGRGRERERERERERKGNNEIEEKDSPGISMITIIIVIVVLLFIFLFLIYTLSVSSIAENDIVIIVDIRLVCVKLQ